MLLYDRNIIGASSEIFGNLRKSSVIFGKSPKNVRKRSSYFRNNFGKSSEIFGKWSEIFGKSSKTSSLVCLCNKQNITCPLLDMNFIFSCSTRHLTPSLRSLVRYRVEHSKIKFISTRGHVISLYISNARSWYYCSIFPNFQNWLHAMRKISDTIASIWGENMVGFLSLDIICSSKLTVFHELRSRKTVLFSWNSRNSKCPRTNIPAYIHQIFSLARDWSKHLTWPNIPQLKLGDIREYPPIFKTARVAKKIWKKIKTITSIWGEKKLGYLSLDIICSS